MAAVLKIMSPIMDGKYQAANLKGQQYAQEANRDAFKQQAATEGEIANADEEQLRKHARSVEADQRVAMSEAGTGILSATNEALAVQSAQNAEQDALNIRYGGMLKAHGLTAEANAADYQAKMAKMQIPAVRAASYMKAYAVAENMVTSMATGGTGGYT